MQQFQSLPVIFGGSFGAGNYAMAGRAYDPRLLFMWPNSKISVMGSDQAAGVLTDVKKEQLKTSGKEITKEQEEEIRSSITICLRKRRLCPLQHIEVMG
jgi:acetyl-CoA carboxylase carboxyltransferase component